MKILDGDYDLYAQRVYKNPGHATAVTLTAGLGRSAGYFFVEVHRVDDAGFFDQTTFSEEVVHVYERGSVYLTGGSFITLDEAAEFWDKMCREVEENAYRPW